MKRIKILFGVQTKKVVNSSNSDETHGQLDFSNSPCGANPPTI